MHQVEKCSKSSIQTHLKTDTDDYYNVSLVYINFAVVTSNIKGIQNLIGRFVDNYSKTYTSAIWANFVKFDFEDDKFNIILEQC